MARQVVTLWWAMCGFAVLVWLAVGGLWLHAMFRPHRTRSDEEAARINRRWIVGGGLVLPSVSVAALLAFGIPTGRAMLPLPLDGEPPLRVEVTGHQWWWEVRYPETGVVTANHLVLPAGRPVDLQLTSADVIHSFWVPRLGGKMDMIPGRTNVIRLEAERPGRFRGQCSEFCGRQHTHMLLQVDALDEEAFAAWQSARQALAPTPAPGAAGQVFAARCGQCHRVAGISEGQRAPDLTDIGTRPTLGAGVLVNDGAALRQWLAEHQRLKPGNAMPLHDDLDADTLDRIAAWLETLAP